MSNSGISKDRARDIAFYGNLTGILGGMAMVLALAVIFAVIFSGKIILDDWWNEVEKNGVHVPSVREYLESIGQYKYVHNPLDNILYESLPSFFGLDGEPIGDTVLAGNAPQTTARVTGYYMSVAGGGIAWLAVTGAYVYCDRKFSKLTGKSVCGSCSHPIISHIGTDGNIRACSHKAKSTDRSFKGIFLDRPLCNCTNYVETSNGKRQLPLWIMLVGFTVLVLVWMMVVSPTISHSSVEQYEQSLMGHKVSSGLGNDTAVGVAKEKLLDNTGEVEIDR